MISAIRIVTFALLASLALAGCGSNDDVVDPPKAGPTWAGPTWTPSPHKSAGFTCYDAESCQYVADKQEAQADALLDRMMQREAWEECMAAPNETETSCNAAFGVNGGWGS